MSTATLTYREAADDAIAELAASSIPFTADHVRDLIERQHPGMQPEHVNHLGLHPSVRDILRRQQRNAA